MTGTNGESISTVAANSSSLLIQPKCVHLLRHTPVVESRESGPFEKISPMRGERSKLLCGKSKPLETFVAVHIGVGRRASRQAIPMTRQASLFKGRHVGE